MLHQSFRISLEVFSFIFSAAESSEAAEEWERDVELGFSQRMEFIYD
jgi:hypothetical protein